MTVSTCLPWRDDLLEPLVPNDPLAYGEVAAPVSPDRPRVRFAVLGDTGLASFTQAVVANGVHRACNDDCDFVLLLGDNLYDRGMAEEADEARLACILSRYPTKTAFLVLGNHDYTKFLPSRQNARRELRWINKTGAAAGAALDHKGAATGETAAAARRTGPVPRGGHHFYRFQAGPVDFVALDTNQMVRSKSQADYPDLRRWLGRLREKPDRWTIAMGHHPYASNGAHGGAGQFVESGFSLWPGKFFKWFMDKHVMARAHLYLSGHDHNLEFFSNVGGRGTAQMVSGAGAKCYERGSAKYASNMEHYGFGFAIVEATKAELSATFFDYNGQAFWSSKRGRLNADWVSESGDSVDPVTHCKQDEVEIARLAQGVASCK